MIFDKITEKSSLGQIYQIIKHVLQSLDEHLNYVFTKDHFLLLPPDKSASIFPTPPFIKFEQSFLITKTDRSKVHMLVELDKKKEDQYMIEIISLIDFLLS